MTVGNGVARSARRMVALALLAAPLLGCGGSPDFPRGYDIMGGDPREVQLTARPALLIADNQRHYLYGKPVWIRTRLVDQAVRTAIRAPQLDLFAPAVLEHALNWLPADAPVIHLGDGMDLSCVAEYQGFVDSMNQAKADWFTAPGNHDGIYFGSTGKQERADWESACDGGGGPINQATYVRAYLTDVLGKRALPSKAHPKRDPGSIQFAQQLRYQAQGQWAYSGPEPSAWLTRVAWNVDGTVPHHSWILQELTATLPQQPDPRRPQRVVQPVKYVLLDTANYEAEPQLLPFPPPHVNAGSTGDLGKQQLERLESWLRDYRNPQLYPGRAPLVVLMGHHPFGELTSRAQAKFQELRSKYGVLTYVSAHTHHGSYFAHQFEETGWVELNVGSVIDWPLEFRDFRVIERPPLVGKHFYTASRLYELSGEDAPRCEDAWKPQSNEPDYYVDYTQHYKDPARTSRLIFDSLLHSYKRLLRFVPTRPGTDYRFPPELGAGDDATLQARIDRALALDAFEPGLDEKRKLLTALESFDRLRPILEPAASPPSPADTSAAPAPALAAATEEPESGADLHVRYRLCQAVWASLDDEVGVRRARRQDFYIGYPPRPVSSAK